MTTDNPVAYAGEVAHTDDAFAVKKQAVENTFDRMTSDFTLACHDAANWCHLQFGASYRTRIRAAIVELEAAIAKAKAHPEIGGGA